MDAIDAILSRRSIRKYTDIAARAKDIGAVWLGIYPRDARVEGMRRLLDIPDQVIPFALIPIGRPAEEKPREDRFIEERVHMDGW